ncbi:hypothetical protein C8R44DRAFT_814549, partial [Mycena epipterygia]
DVVQWRRNSSGGTGWHQDHATSAIGEKVLYVGEGGGSQIPGAKCSTCLVGRRQFRLEQSRRCKSRARGCTACPNPSPRPSPNPSLIDPDHLDPELERNAGGMDTSTLYTPRGLFGKTDSAALVKAALALRGWANTAPTRPAYRFPPPDLVAHLAGLYSTRAHIYLPVLHRQTFERSVEAGMDHW